MHFKDLAKLFNISNFFVYCCLLVFSILLSLRIDELITWNYAVVFIPIWVWNIVLIVSGFLGIGCWIKRKDTRQGADEKYNLVSLIQTLILHLPLFCTEVLVVVNAELGGTLSWTAIFSPVYLLSILSIAGCILGCCIKHCNIEFEILAIASFLQLLFVGLRLDNITVWTWAIVLIPCWICLVLLMIGLVVYGIIKCCALAVDEDIEGSKLRKPVTGVFLSCIYLAAICITVFLALLGARLDNLITASYSALFVPLYACLLFLIVTTFTREPANPWWLGLGKNLAEFILDYLPFVREYANISHQSGYGDTNVQLTELNPEAHYEDIMSVDEVVISTRGFDKKTRSSSKSKKQTSTVHYIDDSVYPYKNLLEPD